MSDDNGLTVPGTRTRRALLAGAGAVGAAVVLAACGGDESDDTGASVSSGGASTGSPGASTGGGDGTAANALATTADIPVGGGAIFAAKGVVITQPTAGVFKGFDSVCTHQRCPVSRIDGGTINCTCHGSKFSIEDGSVKDGPAKKPLPPKEIVVDGDQISLA